MGNCGRAGGHRDGGMTLGGAAARAGSPQPGDIIVDLAGRPVRLGRRPRPAISPAPEALTSEQYRQAFLPVAEEPGMEFVHWLTLAKQHAEQGPAAAHRAAGQPASPGRA